MIIRQLLMLTLCVTILFSCSDFGKDELSVKRLSFSGTYKGTLYFNRYYSITDYDSLNNTVTEFFAIDTTYFNILLNVTLYTSDSMEFTIDQYYVGPTANRGPVYPKWPEAAINTTTCYFTHSVQYSRDGSCGIWRWRAQDTLSREVSRYYDGPTISELIVFGDNTIEAEFVFDDSWDYYSTERDRRKFVGVKQ